MIPLQYEPTEEADVVMGLTTPEIMFKTYHYNRGFHFPTILAKVKRGGVESLDVYERMFWNLHTDHKTPMADRIAYQGEVYGYNRESLDTMWDLYRRGEPETRRTIEVTLAQVAARDLKIHSNINTMLSSMKGSHKIREFFANANPEQYAIMERLMEHRKLMPLVAGNVVTKLPDHMIVSVLTNKEFAKVVQGDFKGTVANAGKYMRVNPRFITEQGMNNLINKIFGRQYNLTEYQKAKLDILIGDMTADDFDNFYKTQYGHLIDQIFYSSDSRVMGGRTLFEFDSDIELPGEGRTMYVSEKHKLFERFTEGLQAYIGIDDESLNMMVYDRMLRSKR